MTRLTPQLTSLKTLNITYRTPQETLLATPETLPTTAPSTPQVSYTVAEADLPTLSFQPYKKVWVAYLVVAGRCPTSAVVYFNILKNGTSVNTGSTSVSANYFYTCNCSFYDVAVGDVLAVKLWSNQTDSNWDYKAYQIQVSRLILMNKPRILAPCNFAAFATQPPLTLGSPSYSTVGLKPYHCDLEQPSISSATNFDILYPKDTYGMFRIYYGDYSNLNNAVTRTSSTNRPYYYRNSVPTQIQMRGVKTD